MLSLSQLWLPILASAIAIFVASSLIHMVFKWHASDYNRLPNEEEVRAALRPVARAPGLYIAPHAMDSNEVKKPEVARKFTEGPVALIAIRAPGPPAMGKPLGLWFLLGLFVSAIGAYLASKMLVPGANFLAVCRPMAAIVFMSYAVGNIASGIWFAKTWTVVAKDLVDAAIYAAVAACAFATLWPAAA
jgi:hypothetical protein